MTKTRTTAVVLSVLAFSTCALIAVWTLFLTGTKANWRRRFSFDISEDDEFDELEMKFANLTRQSKRVPELRPNMTLNDTDLLFFRSVSHLHYECKDWVRMGNVKDGGWSVCQVGPYRLTAPCLVYSFGINNDWSFDDAVSQKYGCKVRAFDPSMKIGDHVRGTNIYFYKIGFGGSNRIDQRNWTVRTLSSLVSQFNETSKIIDYLKFDIELSEWEVLESFVTNPENEWLIKYRVKQLALEIHTELPRGPAKSPTAKLLYQRWVTLQPLETRLGYRRWWFTINPFSAYNHNGQSRSLAYEMVYLNRRFLVPVTNTRWFQ